MARLASNPDARTTLERRVRKALLAIPDVQEGEAVFGDRDRSTAFFVDGTQMANLVGENALALRLSRKKISELRPSLRANPRVDLRRSGGDWIGISFSSSADVALIEEIAAVAASVYRPNDRPSRLPPAGAELARRQKFH